MNKIAVVCGLLFLVFSAGILLVVLGTKDYWNELTQPGKKSIILNVVDAGGSGTRHYVYEYSIDFKTVQQHKIKCEDRGLGNYLPAEFPSLKQKLIECYRKAHHFLPQGAVTPIWVGATAGMRLLRYRDPKRYQAIWNLVKDSLKATDYNVQFSDTIPGESEARYSWIAANKLKKTLRSEKAYGLLEEGSSSLQIAFIANHTADASKHIDAIDVDGKQRNLYEYSYLCYGEVEILRRLHAQIVTDSNFSRTSIDPCSFTGYSWRKTADYLWSVPCVKGPYAKEHFGYELPGPAGDSSVYTINGKADPQKCFRLIYKMIVTRCTKNKPCGMEDIFQPEVRGKYLAIGNFYYTSSFMGLPYNGSASEYWKIINGLCRTPYSEVVKKHPVNKYLGKRCFHSILNYYLLKAGFKFIKNDWGIENTNKINGVGVEWAFGLSYSHRHEGYFSVRPPTYSMSNDTKLKLIFGGILAVAAVVVAFAAVFTLSGKKAVDEKPVYESL